MNYEINVDQIDADGAIREAADAVSGDTRLSFLKKAGVAGAGVVSGGAILSALAPSAFAAGTGRPPASLGKGDIGILNYALTLEYLEAEFYNGATAANMALSAQTQAFLKRVTADENAHVAFLKKHLGGKAVKKPKFNFGSANTTVSTFMATAQVLENTGVHAYSGQALNIKTPAYVAAALSILTVEARHASVIGLLNEGASPTGKEISPNGPFDTPLTASAVLAAVKKTGFIVS
jgi:Ferritin-like domain